jgi:hypothetical protein
MGGDWGDLSGTKCSFPKRRQGKQFAMNFKNQRTRYWITGASALVVGIFVFCFLRFPVEPVITHGVDKAELPKIQAGVRHFRAQKFMAAFRNRKWGQLPALLAGCVGSPVVEVRAFPSHKNSVLTWVKKVGSEQSGYFLMKTNTNWVVIKETTVK